jgi:UDP-glucose 4-epimerase
MDWSSDRRLERACAGIDAIVHLAGMNAADCERDPVAALEFNGVGTARLVRAAISQRVNRLVYLSTAHVYGAALKGTVNELTCAQPRHPYATSHRAGEDAVRLTRTGQPSIAIVARLSNAFGAPACPEANCWSLVTNDLCRQAVTTRRAVLRSAGSQRRDFIPVSEACRAMAHLLSLPPERVGDGLFNIGGAWAPTMLEMARLVAERVTARLGFCPQLVVGTADDGECVEHLEYSVSRLAATGFTLRQDSVQQELDRLVEFCAGLAAGAKT